MLEKIYYFMMVPMVYAAAALFVVGVIARSIRVIRAPRQKTTLQVFPEKVRHGSMPSLTLFSCRP